MLLTDGYGNENKNKIKDRVDLRCILTAKSSVLHVVGKNDADSFMFQSFLSPHNVMLMNVPAWHSGAKSSLS